jgi:hypothetical protein
VSEGGGTGVAQPVFCGACGADVDAAARFCRSCGADQLEFSEPAHERGGDRSEAVADAPPAAEAREHSGAESLSGLLDALILRHGLVLSQPPPASGGFDPGERGAIGALSGLPARVDEGRSPDSGSALIRVRLGLARGDPEAVKEAVREVAARGISASRTGVEVLAAPEHSGTETMVALEYVEDLARRGAAAIDSGSSPPGESARVFTISGYPQWVQTADSSDVEGVELRHFELIEGEAEWEELAVRLSPTADGAMVATGTWAEEAPFISLIGRIALMRQGEGGRETPLMFGSGVCTLTNRRLLAVVYARPDDEVLEMIGQNMRQSGITFQDASGRAVSPFQAMSEEEKALQFIDEAGALDGEGGGVVLALSAFPQAFAQAGFEGGVLQRGLGITGVHLSGGPLELRVVPFRVLDGDSHTVKPQRGQIKNAVNAWWAMTAPNSQ